MEINLSDIGKRFNNEWIFKNLDYSFNSSSSYAILGGNGSGKSTLLKVLSGYLSPSSGTINFLINQKEVSVDKVFEQVSICAPYIDTPQNFTLAETIEFQSKFKAYQNNLTSKEVISIIDLERHSDKEVRFFSSGMKQRLKLALAILGGSKILLLDEPTSNLDKNAIQWYRDLIKDYAKNRILIICSNNQTEEYDFCNATLSMQEYKIS